MIKDFFTFILVMSFGVTVASVIYWQKLTPSQQNMLLNDIHDFLDDKPQTRSEKKHKVVPKSSIIDIRESVKGDESYLNEFFQQVYCQKPETREIKKESSQKIYRWVDENGKMQFSDIKPEKEKAGFSDISANYKESIQYLNLQLIDNNADLLVGNKERITADVTQIYFLLAQEMNVKNLRQIDVKVRLFSNQDDFQTYRHIVAPEITTSSGFYVPSLNEATVFLRKDDDSTYAVIRHEATHVILASLYGRVPVWFNEGLAEYFEQLAISGQGKTVKFLSHYHKIVAEQMFAHTLPGLQTYFSIEPERFYGEAIERNYAIAWSLVFFILSEPEDRAVFSAMIDHLVKHPCEDVDMIKLLNRYYAGGFNNFESKWHNWLANPYNTSHYY